VRKSAPAPHSKGHARISWKWLRPAPLAAPTEIGPEWIVLALGEMIIDTDRRCYLVREQTSAWQQGVPDFAQPDTPVQISHRVWSQSACRETVPERSPVCVS
jgi:hypothetical protein